MDGPFLFDDGGGGLRNARHSHAPPATSTSSPRSSSSSIGTQDGRPPLSLFQAAPQSGGGTLFGGRSNRGVDALYGQRQHASPRCVSPESFDTAVDLADDQTFESDMAVKPAGRSRPGVQFARSHDAISLKMSAFDGNNNGSNRPLTTTTTTPQRTQIEIAPGVMVRLRGAKETWQCVENDFFLPTTCFGCAADLLCIMDACYVVCPLCKVVSPLSGGADLDYNGGVGLGFTWQDLQQWQAEILRRRLRQ